jgi:putative heme-binding domain-containing protein
VSRRGRDGRVFVTICYMAQNEGSPTYRSDLAVITRKDDSDRMPFHPLNLVTAKSDDLIPIVHNNSWSRSSTVIQEFFRRSDKDPYQPRPDIKSATSTNLTGGVIIGDVAESKLNSLKALEGEPQAVLNTLRGPLRGEDAATIPDRMTCLSLSTVSMPQLTIAQCRDTDAKVRMGGVLTAGFRLTMPPLTATFSDEAPLTPHMKEEANVILFADEKEPIDLRKFGRVGNYTVAEHWKALKHTDEQEMLFSLLMERLEDTDDKVRLQAAYFLSLLNDPRSEPKIAMVTANVQDKRLNLARLDHLKPTVWMLGPVPDQNGFQTVHPVETTAIDLTGKYDIGGKSYEWKQTNITSPDRPLYDFRTLFGPSPNSSVYSFFRFDTPTAQRMQLLVGSEDGVKIWQNGKPVFENDVVRPLIQLDDVVSLNLQPGSNDILVRVRMREGLGGQYFHYKHLGDVKLTIPDKPDGLSLAERLKSSGTGSQPIDPKFLEVDWAQAIKQGDVTRGKKLFAAESLGCAKCHAATATQAGGGGPSLADAGKRFTVPYLVESVLAPNKVISPVFKSSVITTNDGKVITGLVVSETSDKLEVLQPDTKRISLNKNDVEERKLGDTSAMPHGIVKTPDELRDVLVYLLSNPTEN